MYHNSIYFQSIDEAINHINERYAFVKMSGKLAVVETKDDDGNPCIEALDDRTLYDIYANKLVMYNGKPINPVKLWRQSQMRREYMKGMTYNPQGCEEGQLNLFTGFAYNPSPEGSWDLLKSHIYNIICNGDDKLCQYFMDWQAHAIQKPLERTETALVLIGGQGTGKSSTLNYFAKLYGEKHSFIDSDINKIVGRFREHLIGVTYVFLDEANTTNYRSSMSKLKNAISSEIMAIESKGKPTIQLRNAMHLVMASNDEHAIIASADERRFAMFNVSNEKQQDTTYFAEIAEQMENGGYERLLYDLQNRNITTNLRIAPVTAGLLNQRIESLPLLQKWWFEGLQRGGFEKEFSENLIEFGCTISTDALYEAYKYYVRSLNVKGSYKSKVSFGKLLSPLVPHGHKFKERFPDGDRSYSYHLPCIEAARKHFEVQAGIKEFDWDVLDDLGGSDPITFEEVFNLIKGKSICKKA